MEYALNKVAETDWIIHDAESGDPYAHTWNEDDGLDLVQQLNNWQQVKHLFMNATDTDELLSAISTMIREEAGQ